MWFRKQMGPAERWARVGVGALLVGVAVGWLGLTPLGGLVAVSGLVTALSGWVGVCPACALAGRVARRRSR